MPDPIEFSLRSLPVAPPPDGSFAAPESRVGPVFVISRGMTPECPTCPVDGPLRGAGSRARQAYRIACG